MPDELAEFFRCTKCPEGWVFEVGIREWKGVCDPTLRWKPFRRWKTPPNQVRLDRARAAALRQPRYFLTCTECGSLTNRGDILYHGGMYPIEAPVCHGCASDVHGVVF